jgi:hypothetical protein
MMGDHRLHSLLVAANCRGNDVVSVWSPFVSCQLARRSGGAFETIGLDRVHSSSERLRPPAKFELSDISVVGADSAEARMR